MTFLYLNEYEKKASLFFSNYYEVWDADSYSKISSGSLPTDSSSFFLTEDEQFIIQENIIDNIVRVQTDGLVLYSQKDFSHLPYYPKPEDKTTGKYTWYSINTNSRNFTK